MGKWGGWLSKILYVLAAFMAAFFLSAVIICGGRESLERKEKQKDRGIGL